MKQLSHFLDYHDDHGIIINNNTINNNNINVVCLQVYCQVT